MNLFIELDESVYLHSVISFLGFDLSNTATLLVLNCSFCLFMVDNDFLPSYTDDRCETSSVSTSGQFTWPNPEKSQQC